jgi:Crp-like helix-turn-helix domain
LRGNVQGVPNNPGSRTLYQVPVLGGASRKVIENVSSPASLSKDGTPLAFIRANLSRGETALVVANADGTGERQVAVRKQSLRGRLALARHVTQISQTAVCNRLHAVEQQLCRWLLLSHDRVKGDELIMTQELIADMLGVRREGVTVAAGRLHDAGAISYVRGHITILDRQKLEETVCECYQVVKDEFDRLLG